MLSLTMNARKVSKGDGPNYRIYIYVDDTTLPNKELSSHYVKCWTPNEVRLNLTEMYREYKDAAKVHINWPL